MSGTDNSGENTSSEVEKQNEAINTNTTDGDIVIEKKSKWLRLFVGSHVPEVPEHREQTPRSNANIFSRITWTWITPLLRTGYLRTIVENDIWLVDSAYANERRAAEYERYMQGYREKSQKQNKRIKYMELRAMLWTLKWQIILQAACIATMMILELCTPIVSRIYLKHVEALYEGFSESHGRLVGLAVGNSILLFLFSYLFVGFNYNSKVVSEGIRCVLLTAIYKKSLLLSPAGRQAYTVSKITSLSTMDLNRIMMGSRWAMMVFLFPIIVGGAIGILVWNLGVAALAGVALIILGLALNSFMMVSISNFRGKSIPFQDKRISLIRETMQNMRIIKYYGWEKSFLNLISKARGKENYYLKVLGILKAGAESIVISIPQFGAVVALGVRAGLGKKLSPALVFPSISLFTTFIPMTMFLVMGLSGMADAWKSFARMEAYFSAPEEDDYIVNTKLTDEAIKITDGCFSWSSYEIPETKADRKIRLKKEKKELEKEAKAASDNKKNALTGNSALQNPLIAEEVANELEVIQSATSDFNQAEAEAKDFEPDNSEVKDTVVRAGAVEFPGLKNINLDIKKGDFVVVVGAIGSGKTTLLSALQGSLTKDSGTVEIDGKVSSCLSNWAKNATFRDNITFGRDFNIKRYRETVRMCCLEDDFANLKDGDQTEVGERGITLSGGQKARLSLARSIYYGGDIYLLDDVLSAVDSKVGKRILDDCLTGALKEQTVILATHHLHIINQADKVIFMDGRGSAVYGTNEELRSSIPEYDVLIENFGEQKEESEKKEDSEEEIIEHDGQQGEPDTAKLSDNIDSALMTQEAKSEGSIKLDVIKAYILSGSGKLGYGLAVLIIFVLMLSSTSEVFGSIWLSFLTEGRFSNLSIGGYLGVYLVIIFLSAVFRFLLDCLCCYFCFTSSTVLHNKAVDRVFNAPMSFFDTTPLGRIVTRFTEDVANMDTNTYMKLMMFVYSLGGLFSTLITVFVYVPYSIILLVPILIIFLICLNYYRASAREIKRFDSLFRSAMIAHTTETYNGLSTILAYGQRDQYISDLNVKIDNMNSAFYLTASNQSWLVFRLCVAATMISFMVTIMCSFQIFSISASSVGLLISILPGISQSLAFMTPTIADLENELNSVERVWEYGVSIPQEAPHIITEKQPPSNWPASGEIEFQDVSLRYRDNMPNVLKNLTFTAAPNEKIGICGRTGAGKSTILGALFRLVELSNGRILIDGLDISKMGLNSLRSKISIIPQEPVLFEGTIRTNLDPFEERTDTELWDALRRAGLINQSELANAQTLGSHKFHLDMKTNDEGANYSLGERQLLTLARALVRQSKILVLDEATATVDYETDQKVQHTIATEFSDCTILCIAHRLKTILPYDRILVLDKGELQELDTPYNLFKNEGSIFHTMCVQSKITEDDFQS